MGTPTEGQAFGAPGWLFARKNTSFGSQGEVGELEDPLGARTFGTFGAKTRVFTCFWSIGWPRGQQGGGRGRVNPPPKESLTHQTEGRRIKAVKVIC